MRVKPSVLAGAIAGAIIMANCAGCSEGKFTNYTSRDPALGISTEYIRGWKFAESRGSGGNYAQVLFYPLKKGEKGSRTAMSVTVKESSKAGLPSPTAEAAVSDLAAKRMKLKEAKVISKSRAKLLNEDAQLIDLSYLLPENLLTPRSALGLVREQAIVFKKGDELYFLRYVDSAAEFDAGLPAFEHMVKALKIKKGR